MNGQVKRWVTGICIGACIPAFFFVRIYRYNHSPDVRLARSWGVDPAFYIEAKDLFNRADRSHTLSPQDMLDARVLVAYPSPNVRIMVVMALGYCADPARRPDILPILRQSLDDKEPGLRYLALKYLVKQNDPDAIVDAKKLTGDVSPIVRSLAQKVLKGDNADITGVKGL